MIFSIIVVCLNAGNKLQDTIESIRKQTERDYEIIVKDGGSTDEMTRACLEEYRTLSEQIRLYCSKDAGIYDGMNQAVQYVQGEYVLFLNCGDSFYDEKVLERVKKQIISIRNQNREAEPFIFYGDIYEKQTGTFVQSNPKIDDFACYRNVPCHQACFYDAELLRRKAFDTGYRVRADYEQFLWCYYKAHAHTAYMPVTVAFYEGGGFSETKENEKKSQREHREIVNKYMPSGKVFKYRLLMVVTLAPLRTWIARNPVTAGIYQRVKKRVYKRQSSK